MTAPAAAPPAPDWGARRADVETALRAARVGAVVARALRGPVQAEPDLMVLRKADGTRVTAADWAVEGVIERVIGRAFPDDALLCEETPESPDDVARRLAADRVWIVDPIDHTTQYVEPGLGPSTAVNIALAERTADGTFAPVVGVIERITAQDRFVAAAGCGTWTAKGDGPLTRLRLPGPERPVSVYGYVRPRAARNPEDQQRRLRAGWGLMAERTREALHPALDVGGGSGELIAALLAGELNGVLRMLFGYESAGPFEWDIAPGLLLVTEAGGTVTDACGRAVALNRPQAAAGCGIVLHSDGRCHDALLDAVAGVTRWAAEAGYRHVPR